MAIKEQLNEKLKEAMRNKDEDGKRVYRMTLASIKYVEKEKQTELDEDSVLAIVQKELKIRREALETALKADREEAAEEARKDIAALEAFMPKQLSEEELEQIINAAIEELGAKAPSDMGKVMKAVMPQVKGKAENDLISKTVKELLSRA